MAYLTDALLSQVAGLSNAELQSLIAKMTPDELAELDALIEPEQIWTPLPGPQTMAYESEADIIGYGGAAGGGKTDLAVGLTLTKHRKTAMFRKEGAQLTGVIDRLADIVGNRDGFNGQDRIWRMPGSVAKRDVPLQVEFGSALTPERHQGRPKDLLVLDETSEIREDAARFLMGWVRTTVPGQRTRTLMTFNPPTNAEGRWIIKFFAPWLDPKHPRPAQPGELRWFTTIAGEDREVPDGSPITLDSGETLQPMSRTFIPSRIADNPYLVGTGYMATLQAMPEPLRSQMLYGDFMAGVQDDAYQVIPTRWVELAQERWRERSPRGEMTSMGVDVARGGNDSTVVVTRHGNWYDKPIKRPGNETPTGHEVAALVISNRRDGAPIHLDVVGVGSSPYDILLNGGQHVIGVNAAESAPGKDLTGRLAFLNYRAWMWWKMREDLDPDNDTGIALPPGAEVLADLTAPRWAVSGKTIKIESREDLIKRIGRSPDVGTAIVQARIETPKIAELRALQSLRADVDATQGHNPYDIYN